MSDDKPMAGLLDRIGVYVLPGRVTRPDRAIGEAQTAEHLGMSRVWLGERLGTKDFGPLLGAVGLATHRIGIGTAITNIGLRHPITLASAAMSLQALTSGRLTLGLGRLHPQAARAYGLTAPDNRAVADTADIVRRLCRGERVSYQGPAGNFPKLRLNDIADVPPPQLILAAIGPKSLALAGRHYDGVLLHPFLTPDAVRRSATRVREAACTEGRDPAEVRVYATVMVAPDLTPSEEVAVLAARAVTYLQVPGYGESIVNANGWDTAPLERLRADPVLAGIPGAADHRVTRHELLDVAARAVPAEWTASATAAGSAAECAARVRDYLCADADELVLHGATPELLGPLLQHLAAR